MIPNKPREDPLGQIEEYRYDMWIVWSSRVSFVI